LRCALHSCSSDTKLSQPPSSISSNVSSSFTTTSDATSDLTRCFAKVVVLLITLSTIASIAGSATEPFDEERWNPLRFLGKTWELRRSLLALLVLPTDALSDPCSGVEVVLHDRFRSRLLLGFFDVPHPNHAIPHA